MPGSPTPLPPETPRTAVIGARGFLGARFLAALRTRHPDAAGTTRGGGGGTFPLDLAAPDVRPLGLAASGHRAALICAAVSSLAGCERDPAGTRRVNVDGTLDLARQLDAEGIVPVFLSSDCVFGGDAAPYGDDATPAPLNEYGRQKAEVEARLRETLPARHLTVRLSKAFSLERGSGTLLDDMARRILAGEFAAADDQRFCPTLAADTVQAVCELLARGARGTVNVCSPEGWSWHELATALAAALGAAPGAVRRMSIDELGGGVRRPHDIRMRPERLVRETGFRFTETAACIRAVAAAWRA
ncbi:MAG TPA: sugar nucleotide-binding protein [Candidatus Methanoperedens sp.]|nr:sugar nucleotide-binding protein [Candidatus Methanoperedens sp.]